MAYYLINNYATSGKIGIADKVFERIVYKVLEETERVELYRKRSIFGSKAISIIRKANDLRINVHVLFEDDQDAEASIRRLHNDIETAIFTLTELKPTRIHIKADYRQRA